jgi:hypothetical protein
MNSKQKKTLEAIFAFPDLGMIDWANIENLLIAVGCTVMEGRGSRVRFKKGGEVETFHRPHPDKEAKRYQVKEAKNFLLRLGVKP